ncbi:MAG: hypothetical protein IKX74_06525 [Erysipelotrichaceae bacterium]|nr:hypothetical protein [Erysipelotrichaceae bacterium]
MMLFIAVYLIALFCYFFTRTSETKRYRALNKYIMATMYLVYGIYYTASRHPFSSFHTVLIIALIFAWLGDIFLVFDFNRGGDFFLAGNVCFIFYEMMVICDMGYRFRDFGWVFLVVALMLGAFIFACSKWPNRFKLGKMKWPMTFYLSSIYTHGITGLALFLLAPAGSAYRVMGIGSFMFMISDIILTLYNYVFGENRWLVRANSLTYFVGLLLIVLSTSL